VPCKKFKKCGKFSSLKNYVPLFGVEDDIQDQNKLS
jgi:hypothetical protein